MKAFVTGGTGNIGRNLEISLRNKNIEVFSFSRGENIQVVRRINPDYIFHVAGEIRNEYGMFDSNVVLTRDLLEASKDLEYKSFVYVGSCLELDPTNLYASTKACGTLLCQAYSRGGNKPIRIIRASNVYGGKYDNKANFIPKLFDKYCNGEDVAINPGRHDYIYIHDFVRALELIAFSTCPCNGEIFDIGSGLWYTNLEVSRMVEWVAQGKTEPDNKSYFYRGRPIKNELGFQCEYDFWNGLIQYSKDLVEGL
jgi:nucleoside-diphosphate-sugar epimerase